MATMVALVVIVAVVIPGAALGAGVSDAPVIVAQAPSGVRVSR